MTKKKKIIYSVVFLLILVAIAFCVVWNWKRSTEVQTKVETAQDFVSAGYQEIYARGILVVGFKKEISQAKAEEILNNLNLKFFRTKEVNRGMKFFAETGETFLVRVESGKEAVWLEKINKIPEIKEAGAYIDPEQVIVD